MHRPAGPCGLAATGNVVAACKGALRVGAMTEDQRMTQHRARRHDGRIEMFKPALAARRLRCAGMFMLLLATTGGSAQDVMQVGADTHSVLLENSRVRVLAAHVAPGAKVPMHSHPANVIYFLGDATLRTRSRTAAAARSQSRPRPPWRMVR